MEGKVMEEGVSVFSFFHTLHNKGFYILLKI